MNTDNKYINTYLSWRDMHNRCRNPNHSRYKDWGGRGITVCEEWNNFENFLRDMGEKPQGFSLERRNNNEGYFPENCRWATPVEQSNNTRVNRLFIAYGPDGQEELAKSQSLFARKFNLIPGCICNCLRGSSQAHRGWTFISVPEDFPRYNEILKLFEVKK